MTMIIHLFPPRLAISYRLDLPINLILVPNLRPWAARLPPVATSVGQRHWMFAGFDFDEIAISNRTTTRRVVW